MRYKLPIKPLGLVVAMRLHIVSLIVLSVVLLFAPGANAAVETAGQVSFGDVSQVYLSETYTGSDARELRRTIDAFGDGDGTVSDAEVHAWDEAHRIGAARDCFDTDFRLIEVDGMPVRDITHGYVKVGSSAVGPTSETTPVTRALLVSFDTSHLRVGHAVKLRLSETWDLPEAWTCAGERFPGGPLAVRPTYLFIEVGDISSLRPNALREAASDHDGVGLQLDDPDEIETAWANTIHFTYAPEGGLFAGLGDELRALGLVLGGLGLLVLFASFASELLRERLARLLTLGILPFYTRIKREKALDHERRERLYAHIRDHQGATFSDLRRALDLGSGSLSHHLRVLEGQGFVKAYRDGLRDRFYLHGPKVTPDAYLTRTQQVLLEAISADPGIHQKELARRLGLTRQSVQYHERVLTAKGVLRTEQEGRARRYFLLEPL